jgi:hypothetical protein
MQGDSAHGRPSLHCTARWFFEEQGIRETTAFFVPGAVEDTSDELRAISVRFHAGFSPKIRHSGHFVTRGFSRSEASGKRRRSSSTEPSMQAHVEFVIMRCDAAGSMQGDSAHARADVEKCMAPCDGRPRWFARRGGMVVCTARRGGFEEATAFFVHGAIHGCNGISVSGSKGYHRIARTHYKLVLSHQRDQLTSVEVDRQSIQVRLQESSGFATMTGNIRQDPPPAMALSD